MILFYPMVFLFRFALITILLHLNQSPLFYFFSFPKEHLELSIWKLEYKQSWALKKWCFWTVVLEKTLERPLVITFLPRSKHLLISWLQSPSSVILEPRKIKSVTVSTVSPSISHEVMGPDAMIFVFWMLSFKPTFQRRQWHPTPVLLPGKSHGQRSLVGHSPWGH